MFATHLTSCLEILCFCLISHHLNGIKLKGQILQLKLLAVCDWIFPHGFIYL